MNKVMILVLLAVIMIAVATPFVIRSILWNRVLKRLHRGQYDSVLKLLDSKPFRLFFSEYDRNWNTLRVYLSQGDNRKIEEQTRVLLDKKLTTAQAYQIASQTYFYFLDRENASICAKLLGFLEKSAGEDELSYDQMLYRVMIEKKSEDIERVEALLEEKQGEKIRKDEAADQKVQIGILQYLLGLQFSYRKDRRQMETYLNKARENLKGTPYHKKVKQLLNR